MSKYTDACKAGIQRVHQLTNDYEAALRGKDHGLAAVIKGQLSAARAYLQGMTDAGEFFHENGKFEMFTYVSEEEQA